MKWNKFFRRDLDDNMLSTAFYFHLYANILNNFYYLDNFFAEDEKIYIHCTSFLTREFLFTIPINCSRWWKFLILCFCTSCMLANFTGNCAVEGIRNFCTNKQVLMGNSWIVVRVIFVFLVFFSQAKAKAEAKNLSI